MSFARVSLALVLLGSVGCATMRSVQNPAQFITQNHPQMVYVTYTDNSKMPVTEPRVSGDSLFGQVTGGSDSVAVPLHDLASIQAVQRDKTKTALLITGIAAGTAAAIYAFAQQIGSSSCYGQGFHCIGGEIGTCPVTC